MKVINRYTTRLGYLQVGKCLVWNKSWKFSIPLGFYKDTEFRNLEEYQNQSRS